MQQITATQFSVLARVLTLASRSAGLQAPAFRSPPRSGLPRSVRRYRDGSAMVSVTFHERPEQDVVADMVEGVVVANRLSGGVADAVRRTLRRAVQRATAEAA